MSILSRAASVLLVVLLGLLSGVPTAAAHAQLKSSNPADGARLTSVPEQIRLEFSEPVDAGFATVSVLGPDGKSHWVAGKARADGAKVSAPLRPLGPKGRYVIKYRVLSADGHPVSGSVTFSLQREGNGTPAPAAAGSTTSGKPPESGVPLWVWFVGAAVLFLAAALAAAFVARTPREA